MLKELRMLARGLSEQRRLEPFTRSQLEDDKLRRFRELARHANASAPYYANIIRERGIDLDRCRPEDFPVLTKAVLMANFDDVITDRTITKKGIADFLSRSTDPNELLHDRYRVLHTSGTSGEVGYFVYSLSDWYGGLMPMRSRQRGSIQRKRGFERLRMAFYGATGGHFAGVTMAKSAERGPMRFALKIGVFEVNDPLPDVVAQLNAFQPHAISGYTNALKVLADRQTAGELRIAPMMISCGGETVTAADCAMLERAFGCMVTSMYGCTEHLMMGSSDPGGESMTLFDDNLIYEFFDDHTLVTNLFNRTLPLIRYRMSDILQPLPQKAGSRHLSIRTLVGRTELVPTFVNDDGAEDFVSPHTINEIFVAGVTRFQLHITGKTSFQFLVCLDPALDAAARDKALTGVAQRLREILAQKRMSSVRFDVEVRDDLPMDARTRKFRLIIDRRDQAHAQRSARV